MARQAGRAVIATDDKSFDQAMLKHMATRADADITYVKASHALFMTQADVVADVIHAAAQKVGRVAPVEEPQALSPAVLSAST